MRPDANGPEPMEDVRLAEDLARIVSVTADRLIFTPDPPFWFGLAQFDKGARVMMEFTDADSRGFSVGDRVRMRFRIKSRDRRPRLPHLFLEGGAGGAPNAWSSMMASGIKDKVAIVGMGCTTFGEHWDKGPEDLIVDAFEEALADAKIARSDIQAAWMGNALDDINVGNSALPLAHSLRLKTIPVSRVENMCATGSEALRAAVYAVAAGAVDFALALGVEKLKDTGYGGLPLRTKGLANDLWLPYGSAPGSFAQLAGAYAAKHRLNGDDLKRAMAHVSWKSHQNAVQNPRAHLRKAVDVETILKAPMIADPLGLYDCCGVSDGAAAAIVTTPDIARGLGIANPVTVKAVQLSASHGWEMQYGAWDGSYVLNTREAAKRAYAEAGVGDPATELSLTEVHDCFSITELVTMEDLGLSEEGRAPRDILDGRYDREGAQPCQIDGGLKCFGHPVGASGLRMAYEVYTQLLGRAGARQRRQGRPRPHPQSRRRSLQQRRRRFDLRASALREAALGREIFRGIRRRSDFRARGPAHGDGHGQHPVLGADPQSGGDSHRPRICEDDRVREAAGQFDLHPRAGRRPLGAGHDARHDGRQPRLGGGRLSEAGLRRRHDPRGNRRWSACATRSRGRRRASSPSSTGGSTSATSSSAPAGASR